MARQNFNDFGKELERVKRAALKGMEDGVIDLQGDTIAITHVLSGDLKRSWTHSVGTEGDKVLGSVGSNLRYAPYEDEYHPTLKRALEEDRQAIFDKIANEIRRQ